MLITPSAAAELLLSRRAARANLIDYVNYLDLGFTPAKHHRLICAKLNAVLRGEIKKLALFLPPGAAKSTYASMLFPAFFLGNNPEKSIIACSHTQELADRFGRKVRNLFASPIHSSLFEVGISRDSQAASHWSTDKDGEYFAAGVGVAISGRRADIGLIDDPVPNRDKADSPSDQQNRWDWYTSDFVPRLKPDAARILIQTRWHERDLAGRILERERSEWDIVELPMEARSNDLLGREPGQILWPEWFTPSMVEEAKLDVRAWNSEYQQNPIAEEGIHFKLDWFPEYDQIPENAHYYGASDYAVSKDKGDFTEHGIFALDAFKNIYVADWWRGQTTSDVWIEHQCNLIQEYEPRVWFGESGPIRKSIEPYLALRMTERNANCRLEWLPSVESKQTRIRAFEAYSSRGKVFLPRNAAWKAELLSQLIHFPAARYDDGVDVCSLLGRGLNQVNAPKITKWIKSTPSIVHDIHDHAWMVS